MQHFDLIVLGSGPSASRIVEACAEKFRTAVVDARALGGTCALRGCNPKKVLVRAAQLKDWCDRSDGQLISSGGTKIDWGQLIEFKRTFTDPVTPGTKKKYAEMGIAMFEAPATFTGPNSIRVGEEELEADKIVICTGAKPAPLNIEGEEHLTLSDEFLEMDQLPKRLVFVGGGYISFEFAHVAQRAGAEVCILETAPQPLGGFESDLVAKLVEHSRSLGMRIETNMQVRKIEPRPEGAFTVIASKDGKQVAFEADAVIHGAGRVPAIAELDLPKGDVKFDDTGILVNRSMRSVSNPRVYAAGDCVSTKQPKLTPVANEQGQTVARNLLDEDENPQHAPDYGVVPHVVYTVPGLASIGLSEAEARNERFDFEVRSGEMSDWSSLRKVGRPPAFYKLLIDKSTDQLLGAHLLAPHAEDTINLFALAMKFELTATQIKSTLFAFPSFTSDVRQML